MTPNCYGTEKRDLECVECIWHTTCTEVYVLKRAEAEKPQEPKPAPHTGYICHRCGE